MTTVIFVRHGQSESNLAQIFTGQGNVDLTPLGREQAARTAVYLKAVPIDAIYSSDLRRAVQTAEPTARMHGLPIHTDPALREIRAGEWEGQRYEYLKQTYPEAYTAWLRDIGDAHPVGGERVRDLAVRVIAAVNRLVRENPGRTIAIFSHATPMRVIGCHWYGYPIRDMAKLGWVPNASVSIADYCDDGRIQVRQFGYDGHQGEASTGIPKGKA